MFHNRSALRRQGCSAILASLLSAALGLALPAAAQAEQASQFPSRPIRFIVPYAPGGLPDTVARVVAQGPTPRMGQPLVVENKPGPTAAAAAQPLATTPAGGHRSEQR